MHRISVLSILGLMFLPSMLSAEVPHTINLQSIVYDASGNVTKSDKVDVSVRILDADNNVVFSEDQPDIQVIEGAINLEIGSESGGVPLEALDPTTGTKLIDVVIDGANPFDLMPLGAVPYAMWAEKALMVANDSIGTEQIKNGSIKAEDIDPLAFSDIQGQAQEGQLPSSVATDAELNAHINSGTAHPASAIVVSGSFITFVADDAQEALQKLDQKLADEIVNRQNAISTVTTNLNNEIAARGAGDAALQGQINTINTTLSDINNIPGTLDDGKIASTIARDSEVTSAISSHNHDSAYVNVVGGDTMDGPLQVNGNIGVTGTVDGVDVSSLPGQIDAKVSKSGDTMTGDLGFTDSSCTDKNSDGIGECTVDGVDVSALQGRVAALEGAPVLPQIVLSADIDGSDGSLNAGYGVGSVSRVSTGLYTITFATPMLNANYVVVGSGEEDGPSEGIVMAVTEGSKTTDGFGFRTVNMSDTHTDTRITLAVITIP